MGPRVLAYSGLANVLVLCVIGAGCDSPSKPTALAVSAIAPSVGAISGATRVTVSGTGFQTGVTVSFGGTVTSANVVSASQIVAEAPAHAAGTVDVVVTNPNGQSGTLTASYTYAVDVPAALTLTSVAPTRGSSAGGGVVRLTGTGFFDTMVATVDGTIVLGLVVISPTSAEVAMPPHARGSVAIAVASRSGHLSWLAGAYEYHDPLPVPAITDVWPTIVSTEGSPLRIKGSGFTGGTDVTIDGVVLPTFLYEDTLYTEAPPHAQGVVDVVVTNPDGQAVRWSGAFTYAPPEFFDFNGTWEGGIGEQEQFLRFTIENNVMVSLSCAGAERLPVPAPTAAGGQLSSVGGSMIGRITSESEAIGTIAITPCGRDWWYASKSK